MYCLTQSLNIAKRKFNLINIILFTTLLCILFLSIFVFKMEEEHFYLHLSSNVESVSPLQVGNKIGNFVTHLSRKLNLSDDWEVGVTDAHYTKSWFNIMKDESITIIFSDVKYYKLEPNAADRDYTFFALKAGNYDSVEDICSIINKVIEVNLDLYPDLKNKILTTPRLEYHKESNKIKMVLGILEDEQFTHIRFSNYLASMLGFLDSQGRQYGYIQNFEPNHPWLSLKTLLYDENLQLSADARKIDIELTDLPMFIESNQPPPDEYINNQEHNLSGDQEPDTNLPQDLTQQPPQQDPQPDPLQQPQQNTQQLIQQNTQQQVQQQNQ